MGTHQKLADSLIFRLAFFVPIGIGLVLLVTTSYFDSNYYPCLKSECLNNFFSIYKYPLSAMGLSIPLSAIAAAIHRSEETSIQISNSLAQLNETLKQNTFTNYIKHKEDFFLLLEKLESACNCRFSDPLHVYKRIFPKNSYTSLNVSAHKASIQSQSENQYLEDLHNNLWTSTKSLHTQNPTEDQLLSFVIELHGITENLRLKRGIEAVYTSQSKTYIWPDKFSNTSHEHLGYIINSLEKFASFRPGVTDRSLAYSLMRDPNSWAFKAENLLRLDVLAEELEDSIYSLRP